VVTAIAGLSRRHAVPSQLSAAWIEHLEEWAQLGREQPERRGAPATFEPATAIPLGRD
jgi:hypothetical protein